MTAAWGCGWLLDSYYTLIQVNFIVHAGISDYRPSPVRSVAGSWNHCSNNSLSYHSQQNSDFQSIAQNNPIYPYILLMTIQHLIVSVHAHHPLITREIQSIVARQALAIDIILLQRMAPEYYYNTDSSYVTSFFCFLSFP